MNCPRGCGLKYQKRFESKHVASECLKNESSCEFCRQSISKADEVSHLNQCVKFPVPCPAGCGIKEIAREKVCTFFFFVNHTIFKTVYLFLFYFSKIRLNIIWKMNATNTKDRVLSVNADAITNRCDPKCPNT